MGSFYSPGSHARRPQVPTPREMRGRPGAVPCDSMHLASCYGQFLLAGSERQVEAEIRLQASDLSEAARRILAGVHTAL